MNSREIISHYENVIIQIATPYSTGTGFYLRGANLIITNEHVVRGNKKVVIAGHSFKKQMVPVVYMDTRYDLAFISPPEGHDMPEIEPGTMDDTDEGDRVIAIGHPFDLKYTATQGIISSLLHKEGDISYIQHDAALNPGNSGGPLVDQNGRVIGINTFIIENGNSIGFSLPVYYIAQCLEEFSKGNGASGVRCASCKHISFETGAQSEKYCPSCGAAITLISHIHDYEPYGICQTVEEVISRLGYDVDLTRKGPYSWKVQKGSADVNISYYEKTGLLISDVYLCTLPDRGIEELYYHLLRANHGLEGISISLRDQDIILSLLIFDQFINKETMHRLFENLLTKADELDNYLVAAYGARWKNRN